MEEYGYIEIDLSDYIGENRSFVSGEGGRGSFDVNYKINDQGDLRAGVIFKEGSAGPPGHAHGGATAAVLDEAMGIACWFKGIPVVTRSLTVDFIRMVPIGAQAELVTSVGGEEGKNVTVEGELRSRKDDVVYARGKGVYAVVGDRKFGNLGEMAISRVKGN